jgi:hypothetical protein
MVAGTVTTALPSRRPSDAPNVPAHPLSGTQQRIDAPMTQPAYNALHAPMSEHAYPIGSLAGDYARAAAGLVLCGAPLLFSEPGLIIAVVLGGLVVLFGAYAIRTLGRHIARIVVTDEGIASRGLTRAAVRWNELDKLRLRYFSTRRDRTRGWLQLSLGGGGRRIELDSGLDGFQLIAARAFDAAEANNLALDHATLENLRTMGIGPGSMGSGSVGPGGTGVR